MYRKSICLLSLACVLVLSCGRGGTQAGYVLPCIREMIADTSSVGHSVLEDYDPSDRYGSIAVVGPEDETRLLSSFLMHCDMFDNVDARWARDSLPDFAGETITSFYDYADTSYSSFFKKGRDTLMRESVVRNAVAAVSHTCYQNPYSNEPTVDKIPAKLIIYSSSYSEPGIRDVDTLFSAFGKSVRLISPVRAIEEETARRHISGRIGIWADSDVLASGVYASAFHSGGHIVDYVGFSPDGYATAEEGFFRFLDMYLATGEVTPLSAVVIDDFRLSAYADHIGRVAEKVNSSTEESYALYRAILSDDFTVVDAVSSIAIKCYMMLRNENFFTHRIQYPVSREYMLLPSAGQDADIKYIEYSHIYVH